jgi:uncharacterized protein (TIGR00730 family)
MVLESISVYCGSSDNVHPDYLKAARRMGQALAQRGTTIIFGGGGTGMMGAMADGGLEAGGDVIGIIPKRFNTAELVHSGLTELVVVDTMHERKALMAERADAFVALPGGYGTLEELFEILTWAQIGMHAKPVGLLNSLGYFQPLLALIDHMLGQGFIYDEHRTLLACAEEPQALLAQLEAYRPPDSMDRWLKRPMHGTDP